MFDLFFGLVPITKAVCFNFSNAFHCRRVLKQSAMEWIDFFIACENKQKVGVYPGGPIQSFNLAAIAAFQKLTLAPSGFRAG